MRAANKGACTSGSADCGACVAGYYDKASDGVCVQQQACSADTTGSSCTAPAVADAAGTCAADACVAGDFGDASTACCTAPTASAPAPATTAPAPATTAPAPATTAPAPATTTPSSADDHADHDHSPSPALIDAASTISQASMVTALAMTIAYMLH